MAKSASDVYIPVALAKRVLESAPPSVVLVGGQSLSFWLDVYGISWDATLLPTITRDMDFFISDPADFSPLPAFAAALSGSFHLRNKRALSALIGSATVSAGQNRFYTVDLIHKVVGLKSAQLVDNAMEFDLDEKGHVIRVLHPVDLLISRCANLHLLQEKQNDVGMQQLELAIAVAREFLTESILAIPQGEPAATRHRRLFDAIRPIIRYSRNSAAIANSVRYGIFVADAIPAWLIDAPLFWEHQWPHLRKRISPSYARRCEDEAGF